MAYILHVNYTKNTFQVTKTNLSKGIGYSHYFIKKLEAKISATGYAVTLCKHKQF